MVQQHTAPTLQDDGTVDNPQQPDTDKEAEATGLSSRGLSVKKSRYTLGREMAPPAILQTSIATRMYMQYARVYAGCNGGLSDALAFSRGVTAAVDAAKRFVATDKATVEAMYKDADQRARVALREAVLSIICGVHGESTSYNQVLTGNTFNELAACAGCGNACKMYKCSKKHPCKQYDCTRTNPCQLRGYICFNCGNGQ